MKKMNLMNFRTLLLTLFFIAIFTSCENQEFEKIEKEQGVIYMSEYLKVETIEHIDKKDVDLKIEIIKDSDIDYDIAEIYINGVIRGAILPSSSIVTVAKIKEFGEVEIKAILKKDDIEIETVKENFNLDIKTFSVRVGEIENDNLFDCPENDTFQVTPDFHYGYHDRSMVFELRIPTGESMTFDYDITELIDDDPFANQPMTVHFRLDDYDNRYDLFELPDDPIAHFDIELDKWIENSVTLGGGVHRLYVIASRLHDRSLLKVYARGGFETMISGYFKSMDMEFLGYPAP